MATVIDTDQTLPGKLARHGVDRGSFPASCAGLMSLLCLAPDNTSKLATAVEGVDKPGLIWLEFQDCAGDTESLLHSRNPDVADVSGRKRVRKDRM